MFIRGHTRLSNLSSYFKHTRGLYCCASPNPGIILYSKRLFPASSLMSTPLRPQVLVGKLRKENGPCNLYTKQEIHTATTESATISLDLGYVGLGMLDEGLKELGKKRRAEILIPGPIDHAIIHFTSYCLMRPAKFRLRPQDKKIGFRREEIIRAVVQMYSQVYEVEEATMPEKDVWENGSPGSLNRPITRGKYGVHMHELEDLILHTGYWNEATHEMHLGLDS